MNKKVLLMILDGWGISKDPKVSAIDHAKTPFIDSLYNNYSNTTLSASGLDVGLPKGQMGNSEVGHMNIGSGRIVLQDLVRLNNEIENDKFSKNKEWLDIVNYVKQNKKPLHIMGLLSKGGVHSHSDHLFETIRIIKQLDIDNVFIHAFMDGRDDSPNEGVKSIENLILSIKNSKIKLASIIGRYYSMDRDMRWERTKIAYDALVRGKGIKSMNAIESIQNSYNKKIFDEFILPIVCVDSNNKPLCTINDSDAVFCFNFRSDRMRQISSVLTQRDMPKYDMLKKNLYFLTMTSYDSTFEKINVLFKKENIKNTLGEVLSKNNKKQLRIAETEKYPHVTFFFSGGKEEKFLYEERILCPSPKVSTYDLQPEMSAYDLKDKIIIEIKQQSHDFICLNLANPDMVGHTGNFNATVQACEVVDECSKIIVEESLSMDYTIIIIADHGNADIMMNKDGSPHTYHTTNLVPFILIDKQLNPKLKQGKLSDISPTILSLMGIVIPKEMSGKSLL